MNKEDFEYILVMAFHLSIIVPVIIYTQSFWLGLMACTDTECAQINAYGISGHVVCYSGGKVIYDGNSTGKIASDDGSDGWNLKDRETGKLVRVSGDCVIEQ